MTDHDMWKNKGRLIEEKVERWSGRVMRCGEHRG